MNAADEGQRSVVTLARVAIPCAFDGVTNGTYTLRHESQPGAQLMDFSNERYVRYYTRDTTGWKLLRFAGQSVWSLLYRKADRAGVIKLDGLEPWEVAVLHCDIPPEVAQPGMAACLQREWIVLDQERDRLVFPKYIEANEAPASDAQRQRESRERRAAVTNRDYSTSRNVTVASQSVTSRHIASHPVTPSLPSRAEPNQAEPAYSAEPEGDAGHAAAARGWNWLSDCFGRPAPNHMGKWHAAYEFIGNATPADRAAVAKSIGMQLGKPGARQFMTPQHLVDYWDQYVDGQPPGSWKANGHGNGKPAGAAEVAAAKAANAAAEARYRAATGEAKTLAYAAWGEAQAVLKKTKELYAWTD